MESFRAWTKHVTPRVDVHTLDADLATSSSARFFWRATEPPVITLYLASITLALILRAMTASDVTEERGAYLFALQLVGGTTVFCAVCVIGLWLTQRRLHSGRSSSRRA